MSFNSLIFIVFIFIFFAVWKFAKKHNISRWFTLTFFSFIFYGWWDWRFLFLIIFSGGVDFFAGIFMVKFPSRKRLFFILSLIGNLGSLFLFKYSLFIATQFEIIASYFNLKIELASNIPEFVLILPVGISFYTFQSMSYTIDIYRNQLKPTYNILHFFSYLSMFPQLVAGPIVRAKDMLKQLNSYKKVNSIQIWNGIKLIVYGLFLKVVIADNLAEMVNVAFSGISSWDSTPYWWVIMISFSFQIYGDFAGYSLIAKGLAKCMGYQFKINFNHPYISLSLKEFWRRWHISLSTWFKDYVYIPLGGNKRGLILGILFMNITMVVSGIWHGAKWGMIIWGLLHGLFLTFERLVPIYKHLNKIKFGKYLNLIWVNILVIIAWVFFRSDSYVQANEIIVKMFVDIDLNIDFIAYNFPFEIFLIIAILIEAFYFYKSIRNKWNKNNFIEMGSLIFAVIMIVYFRGPETDFIYFQF